MIARIVAAALLLAASPQAAAQRNTADTDCNKLIWDTKQEIEAGTMTADDLARIEQGCADSKAERDAFTAAEARARGTFIADPGEFIAAAAREAGIGYAARQCLNFRGTKDYDDDYRTASQRCIELAEAGAYPRAADEFAEHYEQCIWDDLLKTAEAQAAMNGGIDDDLRDHVLEIATKTCVPVAFARIGGFTGPISGALNTDLFFESMKR